MEDEIKQLIEDYKRRLRTITDEHPVGYYVVATNRRRVKAGCYRAIIAELEKIIALIEEKTFPKDFTEWLLCGNDGTFLQSHRKDEILWFIKEINEPFFPLEQVYEFCKVNVLKKQI